MFDVKVGFDSIPITAGITEPNAVKLLYRAAELKAEGVHFATIEPFPHRDKASAREVAHVAESLKLYVEVGMGTCDPASDCRPEREKNRDVRDVLLEMIDIARWSGSEIVRTFVGWLEDRRMSSPTWAEQLDQVVEVLTGVVPAARQAGVKICVENHMDVTACELKNIIERVGSPAVGVCFDTANSLMLCEDPVQAARMLAPYIYCTHIKDATIRGTIEEPQYVSVAIGRGVVDLPAIIKVLKEQSPCRTLSIEDHGGVFDLQKPVEGDDILSGLWQAGRDKLAVWLEEGNRQVDSGEVPVLPEFFDNLAQETLAARQRENLVAVKRILQEARS